MDVLQNPTINYKSFENIVEKNDFGLLKRELYKFIRVNFKDFGFYDVNILNNFNYNHFAKQLIRNSYYTKDSKKIVKYYTFKNPQEYYDVLDFIILYSYQISQGIFVMKTQEKFYHKSLTEILMLSQNEFSEFGLNKEYPYHQLSENYKNNIYIQNYLVNDETLDVLPPINKEEFSDKENNFYLIAQDIVILLETKQGLHYKNAQLLLKDRLFALAQCLKAVKQSDSDIYQILESLTKEYQLPISEKDINIIANSKKYNYTVESISEKIKYNYVRSKDFNYYKITNI